MYPHERSLVKRFKDRPFALVGVNSDRDRDWLKRRIEEESITWRSFWCGPEGSLGRIPSRWNVKAWPTVYLIDAAGVIRYKSYEVGADGKRKSLGLGGDALEAALQELVTEAEDVRSKHRNSKRNK